jgi:hypothetical protein
MQLKGCNVSRWIMERSSVKTIVTSKKWQIFALNFQRRIILVTRSVYCAFKAVLQIKNDEPNCDYLQNEQKPSARSRKIAINLSRTECQDNNFRSNVVYHTYNVG